MDIIYIVYAISLLEGGLQTKKQVCKGGVWYNSLSDDIGIFWLKYMILEVEKVFFILFFLTTILALIYCTNN